MMLFLFKQIRPLVGLLTVATIFNNVDFPAPFGPRSPKIPLCIVIEKFFSPYVEFPYRFDTLVIVSFISIVFGWLLKLFLLRDTIYSSYLYYFGRISILLKF